VVKLMGGAWASANLGKDYDAFRGIAKKGEPSEWCRRFRFPQSAHFALGKYGEAGASILANAWCDRLSYFYAIMQESDKPADFKYTQELADQYKEPVYISQWADTLFLGSPAFQRLAAMRRLQPKLG